MRVPARRIRATDPRPPVGPRASEARPTRASATETPWRKVIRSLVCDDPSVPQAGGSREAAGGYRSSHVARYDETL